MKQQIKRIAIVVTVILTVGSLSIPAFANAREVTEINHSEDAVVQEAGSETPDPSPAETTPANPVEEIAGTGTTEEEEAPKGNLTLVEEAFDQSGAHKQFVTLVSKNGNYFYLIIDRDEKGNNNVYFLNQVDERDLFALMDDKEAAGLQEDWAAAEAEGQQAQTLPVNPQEEPEDTKPMNKTPALILMLVILAALGGGTAFFFLKKKKKKAEAMSPDPDADYEEEDEADDDPDDYDFSEDDDFQAAEGEEYDRDGSGEDETSE